ncbi:MAG: hypothetical protein M3O46_00145, partial [Myxococcota bacterium]|nr:hypothetical protein [Myxococcota bacterium]
DDSQGWGRYRSNKPGISPPSAPVARHEQRVPAAASAGPSPTEADVGGPSGMGARAEPERERKGLGTEFGEARESHVWEVTFTRDNGTSPSEVVSFRYNDRPGLTALGIRVDPPAIADTEPRTRETANPFRANRFAVPPP